MKEFQTKKGGRILYNEDFYNLQEIIDSSVSFFGSLGANFVISGCVPDEDGYISGYVFLDNKIRKVEKTNISKIITPAIVPVDTTYSDTYEDGNKSPIMYNYGCKIIDLAKESSVTNKIIWSKNNGFGNIFDSFLSNFVVLKNSKNFQNIRGDVKFIGIADIFKAILYNSNISLLSTELSDGSIRLATTLPNSSWIIISPTGDITFNRRDSDGNKEVIFAMTSQDNQCCLDIDSASVYNLRALTLKTASINNDNLIGSRVNDIANSINSTKWFSIIDKSNGSRVDRMSCRLYNGVVYIQGELPSNFCQNSKLYDMGNIKVSDYGLPDEIPLPDSAVEFDVISPLLGGVGITVKIMNSEPFVGRFYFDSNALPASDNTTIPAKYELPYMFSPCVAWQYMYKFNNKNNFSTERTEDFVAYSYNDGPYKFIAYNKITITLINNQNGKAITNVTWKEAKFVGAVHASNANKNYCTTEATKNDDGTYDCSCDNGTLYFRSELDSNKLYSQPWFQNSNPILAGKSVQIGYNNYILIKNQNSSYRLDLSNMTTFDINPSTDKIVIHSGYIDLNTVSKDPTDHTPPVYLDTIESPLSFRITSGKDLFILASEDKTGSKMYAISNFTGERQIAIYFQNRSITFIIRRK